MNPKVKKGTVYFGVAAGLILLPQLTNNYHQYIINLIFVNFLVTLGLAIILGYSGQFAFASAGFLGIGAYAVGLGMVRLSLSYGAALLFAALVGLAISILLALIGIRLSRYYLAITTISFTLAMKFIYVNAGTITFGPSGFNIPDPTLLGIQFGTDHRVYYIVMTVVAACTLASVNILKSKIGRAFVAIRDNEAAAAAAAINVKRYKVFAFVMLGVLGSVAGGLYAIVLGRITPEEFGMIPVLLHFVIVVLGGLGSYVGLMLSTIIVTILPELIRAFIEWQEILYGGIIILLILFAPEGLYGLIQKYFPIGWRERLHGT